MRLLPWRSVLAGGVGLTVAGLASGLGAPARVLVAVGLVYVIASTVRTGASVANGPWRLIIIGASFAILEAVSRMADGVLADERYRTPSPVDLVAFIAYGFMIAGGLSMIRARTRERRREDSTDAMIVAVAGGMILLNVVLAPYLQNPALPTLDRSLVIGYVGVVVALIGVVARVSFGPGERNGAYYLLALSTLGVVVADVLLRGFLAGSDWALNASFAVAPIAWTFAAAAISHPAAGDLVVRRRQEEQRVGSRRLLLLAGALLLGPAMLVASEFGSERIDVVGTTCGSAVLALLVLLRMSDLVRAKEGTSVRERRLRAAATRLATASDRAGALRAALDGALEISLNPSTSRAVVYGMRPEGFSLLLAQGRDSHGAHARIDAATLEATGIDVDRTDAMTFEGVGAIDHGGETGCSVLVVPIMSSESERFAAVVTQDEAFSQEQVASYESFASQVGLALESVELREQMHQRRSHRRFRALVENSSDVVLVVDTTGHISFASPAVRRLLGREEANVRGMAVSDLVHRPDQVQVQRVLAAPNRAGTSGSAVEVRLLHGSGELRWFEMEARDLTNDDEVHGIVVTASDISDRKRAEAQLMRSEARFRLMVQYSSDVVAVIDDNSLVSYVSPSIEPMLGYTVADVMGRNVFELLSIAEAERVRELSVPDLTGQSTEVHVQGVDGRIHSLEVGVTDMRSQPEVDGIVLNIRDVSDRKTLEADLRHQALHDDLTGLANRVLFTDRLTEAVRAGSRSQALVAVLFVDLDNFNLINDSLGHVVGDEVLLKVVDRLQRALGISDVTARFGGDDFAILMGGARTEAEVIAVAETLRDALGQSLEVGEHEFHLTASVGIAIDADHVASAEDLLRYADAAVHHAKQAGKNRYVVFEAQMETSASEELKTKNALVRAVENNEFVLHYQPIVDLASSQIRGVEALIRWEDPERGMISPASFIPLAEESGLIRPIGMWVVAQAAHDLAKWRAMGFDIYCSVNVSGRQLDEAHFAQNFVTKVNESGVDPTAIVVELTESVLATEGVSGVFDRFHDEGYRLALDDFGTGYSAFQYLQTFNIDIIKIDRSFVQAMNTADDAGVVEAVLDVARRIEARTLAEGIENIDELRQLKQLGAELGQGYYFSRPIPAEKLQALLIDEQSADLRSALP